VKWIRHKLEKKIWLNSYSNVVEIVIHENLTRWVIRTENDKTIRNEDPLNQVNMRTLKSFETFIVELTVMVA